MAAALSIYPDGGSERDRWIAAKRGERLPVTADQPYAFLLEKERFEDGDLGDVATIFLTNRVCPWQCVMCDLWRHTLPHPVAKGDIPKQIQYALNLLPAARQIKLYNSGSFFDRGAIPPEDYGLIAELLRPFERVIVECHPALIGESCLRFAELLPCQLEVAMGLETAHPGVLEKLNKRMTLDQYAAAACRLQANRIALRSFVLIQPPFMTEQEALFWACRSIDFAQASGAIVVSLISTRGGNGALDELAAAGEFTPPSLPVIEDALAYGVGRGSGRVFLDLWDFERIASCSACRDARKERLHRMNLWQSVEPRIACAVCGGAD